MKSIHEASASYLIWLHGYIPLNSADLKLKTATMREGPFPFLRGSFYRWAQVFPQLCEPLMNAPTVLGIGDLHLENFGTWRDSEGRLVWGINDFDEACHLPYTSDLVRLATSAHLAVEELKLNLPSRDVCTWILEGYNAGLREKGNPFVLAEQNLDLHSMAVARLKDPGEFWTRLDLECRPLNEPVPSPVRKALLRELPAKHLDARIRHRVAGVGSLGRRRFVATMTWHAANIAREAKELAPSAWRFAKNIGSTEEILYNSILKRAIRCPDPFVRVKGKWIVRRLAPDCSKIDLKHLPKQEQDAPVLLTAMGYETANIHLGSIAAKILTADLRKRKKGWLDDAARIMADSTRKDWKNWSR
jgi:Uncharacterized protein conserved in bacteria (DUF2252)